MRCCEIKGRRGKEGISFIAKMFEMLAKEEEKERIGLEKRDVQNKKS